MAGRDAGARPDAASARELAGRWLQSHRLAMWDSLRRLLRTPLPTLMTLMVIGIAMALPAWLFLLLSGLTDLRPISEEATISVYLKARETEQAETLLSHVRLMPQVQDAVLVTADQAMQEFERYSGLGDVLATLDENPLSAYLLVTPAAGSPGQIESLRSELERQAGVESAVLDMLWVQRLFSLLQLLVRCVEMLAVVLGLAVVLAVGNTVRLAIEARRDEIRIVKLVGATDAFVRRPFIYTGLWFGLGGGLVAALLVLASLWLLSAPLRATADLYQELDLVFSVSPAFLLSLLGGGAFLGGLAAWLVTQRYLLQIRPS